MMFTHEYLRTKTEKYNEIKRLENRPQLYDENGEHNFDKASVSENSEEIDERIENVT